VLTSTVVTPIRLYPLHCTLYCCTLTPTLTRRQSSALVTLSSAIVSDFLLQVLQCSLYWLQLSQHFLLAISFKNQKFFPNSFFCWKWVESCHNAWLWTRHSLLLIFSLSTCAVSTLLALIFFCVSHFSLLIFVLFQTRGHTFVNSFIILPYSGFQLLLFLGRAPNKPLDIANLFRPSKHDWWRFELPCRCSSNCSS
jgi:hypothetical protein